MLLQSYLKADILFFMKSFLYFNDYCFLQNHHNTIYITIKIMLHIPELKFSCTVGTIKPKVYSPLFLDALSILGISHITHAVVPKLVLHFAA